MDFKNYRKIWFTSDLHFGHGNILKWSPETRPWTNTQEMEDGLVHYWNGLIDDKDLVFILGDLAFMNVEDTVRVMKRLKGSKILVNGNHDFKNLRSPEFRAQFLMCKDVMEIQLKNNYTGKDQRVIMNHFPQWEWNQMHRGSFHLHGHVHGKMIPVPGRIMDVGWDCEAAIYSWDTICYRLSKKEIREH